MEKLNKENYFKCECGMFKMKHTSCLNPANGTCDKENPFVITEHEYNNISQPASPPSMPDDSSVMDTIFKKVSNVETADGRLIAYLKLQDAKELMFWMRSQCDGLIKQKDEAKEHKCKYCGVMTTQPDEECYKKPSISDDVIEDIIKKWSVTLHHAHSSLTIGMQDIPALIGFNAVSAFKEFRSQCEKDVEFSKYVKTALNLGGDTMAIVSDLLRKRNEIFNQQER